MRVASEWSLRGKNCIQPQRAWLTVWLQSSSMACFPRITIPGSSRLVISASIFATARGCSSTSVATCVARSAPIASAVRRVSCRPRHISHRLSGRCSTSDSTAQLLKALSICCVLPGRLLAPETQPQLRLPVSSPSAAGPPAQQPDGMFTIVKFSRIMKRHRCFRHRSGN